MAKKSEKADKQQNMKAKVEEKVNNKKIQEELEEKTDSE